MVFPIAGNYRRLMSFSPPTVDKFLLEAFPWSWKGATIFLWESFPRRKARTSASTAKVACSEKRMSFAYRFPVLHLRRRQTMIANYCKWSVRPFFSELLEFLSVLLWSLKNRWTSPVSSKGPFLQGTFLKNVYITKGEHLLYRGLVKVERCSAAF